MEIKDIMVRKVLTAGPDETVTAAAKKMRDANIGCLVIVNSGTMRGIVTDRDLTVRCSSEGHDPRTSKVSQFMTAEVVSAQPSTDILTAAHIMTEEQIKRLPVLDGGQLVGLVSFSDIAQALAEPMTDLLMGMGAVRRAA